jgi:hypothetical protein
MMNTIRAVVREGKIELLEKLEIPEGTELLVTILSDEMQFWLGASQPTIGEVWDNAGDDVYEQLLKG